MKQFYLICMLLLASLATFGRDVTVHVTDQRGAAVSGLPVQFDNESFDTDVNGDFVIKGLGSSNSGEVDLEEEQGVVTIAPKDGKYKVSLGNIRDMVVLQLRMLQLTVSRLRSSLTFIALREITV